MRLMYGIFPVPNKFALNPFQSFILSQPYATTDILSVITNQSCLSLEFQVDRTIQQVLFYFWLLLHSIMLVGFIHVLRVINSSFLVLMNNSSLYGCNMLFNHSPVDGYFVWFYFFTFSFCEYLCSNHVCLRTYYFS